MSAYKLPMCHWPMCQQVHKSLGTAVPPGVDSARPVSWVGRETDFSLFIVP